MASVDNIDNTNIVDTSDCWSCEALQTYSDLASSFAKELAEVLQDPMLIIFGSLCGLWVVVTAIKLAITEKPLEEFKIGFVYITIASILLSMQGSSLIERIYNLSLQIMTASSEIAFKVACKSLPDNGLTGLASLAYAAEQAVGSVFIMSQNIVASGSKFNIANWIYAIVLSLPYLILTILYSSQIVVAIFRVMMLATLSPFLFVAFAFDWGREMAKAGVKTLISAIIVLFASTVAVSLTIYGVNVINYGKFASSGADLNAFASIGNPNFLTIVMLGWAGSAFLTEATSIANSIAGSSLTNTAAGIMSAGMMTAKAATSGVAANVLGGSQALGAMGAAGNTIRGGLARGAGGMAWDTAKGLATGESSLYSKIKNADKS